MQVMLLNNKINGTGSIKCEHKVFVEKLKGRDHLEYVDTELEDGNKISLSQRGWEDNDGIYLALDGDQ
jgi:hypothetical protein